MVTGRGALRIREEYFGNHCVRATGQTGDQISWKGVTTSIIVQVLINHCHWAV